MKIAINGFGRMGRLALRAALSDKNAGDVRVVHINEPNCDVDMATYLLEFDSVHGRWTRLVRTENKSIVLGTSSISYSSASNPADVDWVGLGADVVIDCSGKFKTGAKLEPYFKRGVKKVVVSSPIKQDALNIVVGVNDHLYDPDKHHIITAASCTTNCLAPIVKVIHELIGIKHGMITTLHNVTNTQAVIDKPAKDFRRARSALLNLIPTTTGSATAISLIFPELKGKLDGVAVRVPLLNASITDCVFELNRATSINEINDALKNAANGPLRGILAYEDRPLVSTDYKSDPHSATIDGLSTMVTNGTQVKVLAWYDNEMGYANRLWELARTVASGQRSHHAQRVAANAMAD